MNTDKTLKDTFASRCNGYPIWYYKEIEEVDLDYVIFNLVKETFVVRIDDKNIVVTFGVNENGEIGCTQSCDEGLDYTSYETTIKAFKQGIWFKILDKDTSPEFKENYKAEKEKSLKNSLREQRIKLLTNALIRAKEVHKFDIEDIDKRISELNDLDDEELQSLVTILIKSSNP